ncbi:unnamed protein product [Gulo gulo]|uniref:Uncharacterized protein n=1 Tax=Gulo gulo TaxID=48420 RepID=A0A9X9LS31_GULGU|nr:unnamed protein product [Gulo gulo]
MEGNVNDLWYSPQSLCGTPHTWCPCLTMNSPGRRPVAKESGVGGPLVLSDNKHSQVTFDVNLIYANMKQCPEKH